MSENNSAQPIEVEMSQMVARVRRSIEQSGLTTQDVAGRAGVDHDRLTANLDESTVFMLDDLVAVALALDVLPSTWMDGGEE